MLLHFCDPKEALLHIYVYKCVSGKYNGYHKSGHVLHGVSIHEQAAATLLELPLPKAKRSRKQSVVTSTTFDGTAAHSLPQRTVSPTLKLRLWPIRWKKAPENANDFISCIITFARAKQFFQRPQRRLLADDNGKWSHDCVSHTGNSCECDRQLSCPVA